MATNAAESQDASVEGGMKEVLEDLEEGKEAEGKVDEEGKTEEEKAAEAAEAELAKRLEPQEIEDKGMKRMETPEEAKARVEAEDAAAAAKEEEPSELDKLRDENRDLRQLTRSLKKDQAQMKARLDRLAAGKPASDEGEEEVDEDGKPVKKEEVTLSRLEELQEGILQIGREKGPALDILLETMGQNEAYKDVQEVCSRGNFDDIFEAIATEVTKDDPSKNFDEVLLEVELNVWNKANPYKYMYDLIKKYHPSYAKKEEVAAPGGKKEEKEVKVTDAPGTIANKGGDANLQSGWTKARIDDLSEEELDQVPADIYDKYMRDELK